jgi:hypothetical protein
MAERHAPLIPVSGEPVRTAHMTSVSDSVALFILKLQKNFGVPIVILSTAASVTACKRRRIYR